MADQFEPLEVIGRGSFGLIRKVRRKSDLKVLARKEISYRQMNVKEKNQLMAEFRILKSLVYPNIVRYYYHDHVLQDHSVHLYMEYCDGGDLAGVIRNCKQSGEYVPESLVWSIFMQLTLALYRCHYNSDPPPPDEIGSSSHILEPPVPSTIILHRDIKPDNVFLDHHNTVKLGDFGLAKILDQEHVLANTYVGTPYYMSPEVLNDQPSTPQSDVWSLGCVIYELCAKHPPFQAKSHMQLSQRIKEGTYPPLPSVYSDLLGSTIASCLAQDFRMRPTTAALLHTSMFNFCRKERDLDSLQRDLQAAKLQVEQERTEIEQSRSDMETMLAEIENKQLMLKSQEEDFALERDALLKEVQDEQDAMQMQMKAFMEDFEIRVDQEAQRRVDIILKGKRNSFDHTLTTYNQQYQANGIEMKSTRSDTGTYSHSTAAGTPNSTYSSQFASDTSTTSIQSIPYTSRSGVKGPRLIRDSSLNSNQSRSPRKYFSFDEENGTNPPTTQHYLERKISGQSLASHGSHNTSISRMGSNASASSRISSPMVTAHQPFESKQYSPSQLSPRKPSGSYGGPQQYGHSHTALTSPLTVKPPGRGSPDKDTEMTSPVRQYPLNSALQNRHTVLPMDDSSNSSVSAYSLHSSHLSASSASSVEAENCSRLSSEFTKQTLAGYPALHPHSQQGQTHNLHMFEAAHYPTRALSTKTEGYARTKTDIQSLDDGSVTTLHDINSQASGQRYFIDSGDDDDLMSPDPSYSTFKPKRSISSPTKSSAHMGKPPSPQKSAAAMVMMIEAASSSSSRNITAQHAFSNNRTTNLKSPVTIFSPATPRDRQAPHFQAIYSSSTSSNGSGDRSRQNSPDKEHSVTNSPLLGERSSFGYSNSVSSNTSRRGSSGISSLEESRSPVFETESHSKPVNTTGSSPRKHSPVRKPVNSASKKDDVGEFATPKSAGIQLEEAYEIIKTPSPPTRQRGHEQAPLSNRNGPTLLASNANTSAASSSANNSTSNTRKEEGLGPKPSAPTSKERNGIVAAGFVKRRCETWDENWDANIEAKEEQQSREASPSPLIKRRERRV